jgi:hypothetical protein
MVTICLKRLGVTLIAANAPDHFLEDTPSAVLIRQVLGAIAQFQKASLVAKLKVARDRKKAQTGKCGGHKSMLERNPQIVATAKRLGGPRRAGLCLQNRHGVRAEDGAAHARRQLAASGAAPDPRPPLFSPIRTPVGTVVASAFRSSQRMPAGSEDALVGGTLTLVAPEASEAGSGAQFPEFGRWPDQTDCAGI